MTAPLDPETQRALREAARRFGTPCYVYFVDRFRERFDALDRAFGGRFSISYAVKANPNHALLERIRDKVATLDVSSAGELRRALEAGYPAAQLTFSGPAKREEELAFAVEVGCGEMICESAWELERLDALAARADRRVTVYPRINPKDMPSKFGVNMAGRPSQFGIDEEDFDEVVARLPEWKNLDVGGFHIYSGTGSLSEEALAENFEIFIRLFSRFAKTAGIECDKLIFGSGFGIPYTGNDRPLDLEKLAAIINPQMDALAKDPHLRNARYVLEMGRFLIGPVGYYLTSVVGEKSSRGTEIRLCDGGMNHHLAACGLLGAVIRRNWPIWNLADDDTGNGTREYTLVGPLCTTIDTLATRVKLPPLARGDVIAIGSSGAYGLTSSPTEFISHPKPRELLVVGTDDFVDVTETGR